MAYINKKREHSIHLFNIEKQFPFLHSKEAISHTHIPFYYLLYSLFTISVILSPSLCCPCFVIQSKLDEKTARGRQVVASRVSSCSSPPSTSLNRRGNFNPAAPNLALPDARAWSDIHQGYARG